MISPITKKIMPLICLGMILSCSIPYNDITLFKDLHVWLSILFVAAFIVEWFLYIPIALNKNLNPVLLSTLD